MKTRDLVLMAMYTAMFVVLEVVVGYFNILKMPQGGSVGVSAVVVMLAAYTLGFWKGFTVGFLGTLITGIFDPFWIVSWVQFFFDYPLAFASYAFCALIPNYKKGNVILPFGVLLGGFMRFMSHNIAGWFFFADGYPDNVLMGVMGYNATYMIPTVALTFVLLMAILPRVQTRFK